MREWKPPTKVYVVVNAGPQARPVLFASWSKKSCEIWIEHAEKLAPYKILGPYSSPKDK